MRQQVKDEFGNPLPPGGGTIVFDSVTRQLGPTRVGETVNLIRRLKHYQAYAKNYPTNDFEKKLGNCLSKGIGWRAFRVKILAVCSTKKELIATERFWTLYLNRKANERGFNLAENYMYNKIVGPLDKTQDPYPIRRTELIRFLLKDISNKDIRNYYGSKFKTDTGTIDISPLNSAYKSYFWGNFPRDRAKIQARLIRPLFLTCLKRGYSKDMAYEFFKHSGVEIFDHQSPSNKYKVFTRLLKLALHDIPVTHKSKDLYESYLRFFFVKPFIDYLQDLGLSDLPEGPKRVSRIPLPNEINALSIVEILYSNYVSIDTIIQMFFKEEISAELEEISLDLGSGYDSAVEYNKLRTHYKSLIWNWMRSRWEPALNKLGMAFNVQNLRYFLKTSYLGKLYYLDYLDDTGL